jgi:WD40 repeat protein
LSGSKDRGVQFWNPSTGDAQLMLQGHKNSVISVAPSPVQGGLFATGSGDMRARIWRFVLMMFFPCFSHLTDSTLDSHATILLGGEWLRLDEMSESQIIWRLARLVLFAFPCYHSSACQSNLFRHANGSRKLHQCGWRNGQSSIKEKARREVKRKNADVLVGNIRRHIAMVS